MGILICSICTEIFLSGSSKKEKRKEKTQHRIIIVRFCIENPVPLSTPTGTSYSPQLGLILDSSSCFDRPYLPFLRPFSPVNSPLSPGNVGPLKKPLVSFKGLSFSRTRGVFFFFLQFNHQPTCNPLFPFYILR